jgi:hypothetical protein
MTITTLAIMSQKGVLFSHIEGCGSVTMVTADTNFQSASDILSYGTKARLITAKIGLTTEPNGNVQLH